MEQTTGSSRSGAWEDAKWHRYGLLAGVIFVVLNVIGFFAPGAPPSSDASASEITSYISDHTGGIKLAGVLFALGLIFGLWWLGSLWRVIGRLEPSGPRLALIAVAGMVMVGALAGVSQLMFTAVAVRPAALEGNAELVWATTLVAIGMSMAALATHMLALGALVLWTRFLPAWMGWLALLSTLACVVATFGVGSQSGLFLGVGAIGLLSWFLWVLLASILLYRTQPS